MMRTLSTVVLGLAAATATAGEDLKALEAEYKATCQKMIGERLAGTNEDVIGHDGWVVLTTELYYAALGPFWGEAATAVNPRAKPGEADPIPAIVDFNRQLAARGITLIFMPVPTRVVVYPEAILGKERLASFKDPPHLHSPERKFYELLQAQGVRVIDLTQLFLARRDDPHGPLYCPSESHWTGAGVALASAEVAKLVKTMPWYRGYPKQDYVATWRTRDQFGGIYKDLKEKAGLPERPPDRIWMRSVKQRTPAGEVTIPQRNPSSPMVVIGDSNVIWWGDMSSTLPEQLAADLGFPVDVLSTTGGGATNTRLNFVRTAHAEAGYLSGKRVVIWCFTSRSFRGSDDGWKLVPLDQAPAPEPTKGG